MKKLLFAISQLYKGGAETSLVNLLNCLDYKRYDIEIVILNQLPIEGVVSLIPQINENIKICDAYAEFQKINILDRVRAKFQYTLEQKAAFYFTALDFVRNKVYDYAFWVGEWVVPSFVAYHVNAVKKAAWLHTDISAAHYFDAEAYFSFDDCIDKYIFVSKNSKNSSLNKYNFLKEKSEVIYNISNTNEIKSKAKEEVTDVKLDRDIPVILTCANVRDEKNHLRQVRVMSELKRRGIEFYWLNIGSKANRGLVAKVNALCKKEGLEEYFLLLGAKHNPYKYMKMADAVTVLSDFESWSMVITEAKILGIPVIATKTSGALEQIENGKTGLLTDFCDEDIVRNIERFLVDRKLQKEIKENLKHFDNTNEILKSFEDFIQKEEKDKKDILYIIDDINYKSGAHSATMRQIRELISQGREVSVFSNTIPSVELRNELSKIQFKSWMSCTMNRIYVRRVLDCITDKSLAKSLKKARWHMCCEQRMKKGINVWDKYVLGSIAQLCSEYSTVAVMSEASAFRRAVALADCKNKVQFIHTDYCEWKKFNDWTKEVTKDDERLYSQYNTVVVLSEKIKSSMITLYPVLEEKVVVTQNLMPVDTIVKKAQMKQNLYPLVRFVTVGRLSSEKAYDRLIDILAKVKRGGYKFLWEIIGDGPEEINLKKAIESNNLEEEVVLLGQQDNPYYYVKKAQVFALLSYYEGMPNTIYESLIIGTPVLATDVGGVSEQIENGVNGWLVKNDKDEIYEKIIYLIEHQAEIENAKKRLENYQYQNEIIKNKLKEIFS